MTSANPENRASIFVLVFVAVASFLVRLCYYAAGALLLIWVYGCDRVLQEHLSIVKHKPIVVSNGDILYGRGFQHYLIAMPMWLVSTIVCLLLIQKLLPPSERAALKGRYTVSGPAVLMIVALFFAIGMLPLWQSAMVFGCALAGALILSWRRTRSERPG